jgi:hypothetical protein
VSASGLTAAKTTVLLTPAEIDEAAAAVATRRPASSIRPVTLCVLLWARHEAGLVVRGRGLGCFPHGGRVRERARLMAPTAPLDPHAEFF